MQGLASLLVLVMTLATVLLSGDDNIDDIIMSGCVRTSPRPVAVYFQGAPLILFENHPRPPKNYVVLPSLLLAKCTDGVCDARTLVSYGDLPDPVLSLSHNADGYIYACYTPIHKSSQCVIWDNEIKEVFHGIVEPGTIGCCTLAPNGDLIASRGGAAFLRITPDGSCSQYCESSFLQGLVDEAVKVLSGPEFMAMPEEHWLLLGGKDWYTADSTSEGHRYRHRQYSDRLTLCLCDCRNADGSIVRYFDLLDEPAVQLTEIVFNESKAFADDDSAITIYGAYYDGGQVGNLFILTVDSELNPMRVDPRTIVNVEPGKEDAVPESAHHVLWFVGDSQSGIMSGLEHLAGTREAIYLYETIDLPELPPRQ